MVCSISMLVLLILFIKITTIFQFNSQIEKKRSKISQIMSNLRMDFPNLKIQFLYLASLE